MATQDDQGIYRLEDIIVREVSLVDRAANGRKFLMLKRAAGAEPNEDTMTKEVTPNAEGGFTSGDGAEGVSDETEKAGGAMLKACADAMQKLTALANRMKGADAAAMKSMGQEMAAIARSLMAAAGADAQKDEEGSEEKEGEKPAAASTETENTEETEKAFSEDLLKNVTDLLAGLEEPEAEKTLKAENEELKAGLEKSLDIAGKLVETVKGLRAEVNELKASPKGSNASREEGKDKPAGGDVHWPMDLNSKDLED